MDLALVALFATALYLLLLPDAPAPDTASLPPQEAVDPADNAWFKLKAVEDSATEVDVAYPEERDDDFEQVDPAELRAARLDWPTKALSP